MPILRAPYQSAFYGEIRFPVLPLGVGHRNVHRAVESGRIVHSKGYGAVGTRADPACYLILGGDYGGIGICNATSPSGDGPGEISSVSQMGGVQIKINSSGLIGKMIDRIEEPGLVVDAVRHRAAQ